MHSRLPLFLRVALTGVAASIAAGAAVAAADHPDGTAIGGDVPRSSVTTMPAYSVDEPRSAKTHTLFMGADIAINLDRDLYKVQDVMGSNWVVSINGRDRVISAKEAPLNVKITPNLKLTETSVSIAGFMRVQAYSFANDPSVLLTKGLSRSAAMGADLDATAANAQARQDTAANHALGGASLFVGSDDQFSANAQMTTAQFAYSNSHPTTTAYPGGPPLPSAMAPSTNTNTTGYVVLPGMQIFATESQNLTAGISQHAAQTAANQTEMGNEATGKLVSSGLDAIDVSFDVRAGKMLRNPYIVTMTKFRRADAKPGVVQNMVYARSLHPIDEHVSHIHFVQEGFPMGFELLDFQMHLYNRGVEVATNIASNRVELTRDEAFEYVKMEYIGSHAKDSLPAVPAMGKLPGDLPARLAEGKYRSTVYVRVSRDGLADEAFLDEKCQHRATDPYLETVVRNLRFKPALDRGKPVTGVAALDLNKLQF